MGKFLCEEDYKANTILTSEVSGVKLYFQKLKKTCAVCEEVINGVYYSGQDKRILCETHYKVEGGLKLSQQNQLYFRNCWETVLGVETLWAAVL